MGRPCPSWATAQNQRTPDEACAQEGEVVLRATAIKDYTGNEQVRIVVDRDGCRIADLSVEQADTLRQDRRVDERMRDALTALTVGVAER